MSETRIEIKRQTESLLRYTRWKIKSRSLMRLLVVGKEGNKQFDKKEVEYIELVIEWMW